MVTMNMLGELSIKSSPFQGTYRLHLNSKGGHIGLEGGRKGHSSCESPGPGNKPAPSQEVLPQTGLKLG